MIGTLGKVARALRRFARDRDGTATVEFALLFPPFILLFASGLEAGFFMVRNVMLERAVDLSVRDLRIGTPNPPTFEEFRTSICDEARIIPDCMNNLQVELQPVSSQTWTPLNTAARCIDRAEEIAPIDGTTYVTGMNNDFMLVRICAQVDPIFPNYALGAVLASDGDNGYSIVVTSAYVNEPTR